MDDLSATQLRNAITAVGELAELQDLDQFPRLTAELLRRLIPSDIASYTGGGPTDQARSCGRRSDRVSVRFRR